jgi:hypothetical protein
MSVIVQINSVDKSDHISFESLQVEQNLTNAVDVCRFVIRKYGGRTLTPAFNDDVKVFDGTDQIFGGTILRIREAVESGGGGVVYECEAVDYTYEMDKQLVSGTYDDMTIKEIITDILDRFAPDFNADNVESSFEVEKIVFNQVPVSQCLKRLASIVQFDWYVDENKSVHFFGKFSKSAPYTLTDTSGNFVYKSLERTMDGSQVVNRVKVRGALYNGALFTDSITVKGNSSKSFKLPYKFANLTITLNTVAKTVGAKFLVDFADGYDVLYDYNSDTIEFPSNLADGNVIGFSGNPKVRVMSIAQDAASAAQYGVIEKIVREDSIKSNVVARKRATAELYAYANTIVDAKFSTYNRGLRAGMVINVQSDRRAAEDDLIIKKMAFRMIDPENFAYQVECVSTKRYDLISVLQKLLEPEDEEIDSNETSEEIFSTEETVSIGEVITLESPDSYEETVTIVESIAEGLVDPANVVFVLGPYTPTSDTDPKRQGRLDISLKAY